jgi:hypothetical protein
MNGVMKLGAYLFCVVPRERADALLGPLREHFAHDPRVEVLVERREPDGHRRPPDPETDRERRALVVIRDILRSLPAELQDEARHLRFVQRLGVVRGTHQDAGTAKLVDQIRAGDPEAVSELWWRFFERVHLRLRQRLGDAAADQAAARDVLGRILDELDGYDAANTPLAAWLDAVVDRYADERASREAARPENRGGVPGRPIGAHPSSRSRAGPAQARESRRENP